MALSYSKGGFLLLLFCSFRLTHHWQYGGGHEQAVNLTHMLLEGGTATDVALWFGTPTRNVPPSEHMFDLFNGAGDWPTNLVDAFLDLGRLRSLQMLTLGFNMNLNDIVNGLVRNFCER
jgi:hypothetical protein